MKIIADAGCYLTEAAEVAANKRTFRDMLIVDTTTEAAAWRQVTEAERKEMEVQSALFGQQDITPSYLAQVDTLMSGIAERINDTPMTAEQSLKNKKYYPQRKDIIGKQVNTGFRFNEGETMYEVLKPHTISAEWVPGQGTESLYKVVQEEHEGTKDDPIPWQLNMELYNGKYYTDKGVKYLCIRNSGMGLSFALADLVSGGYVRVVNE